MNKGVFQIQIMLKGSKPRIWRRILVASDTRLPDFHKIIQTTMGWTNSHLHQFVKGKTFYAQKTEEDEYWGGMNIVDYAKIKISDLLKKENESMMYEYDFGDGWMHDIILEKVDEGGGGDIKPVCLGGKNSCPPEDCGGIWGYADLLEALQHPNTRAYNHYMEWLGQEFDPAYFNKNQINEMLKTKNFGCNEFF